MSNRTKQICKASAKVRNTENANEMLSKVEQESSCSCNALSCLNFKCILILVSLSSYWFK